MNSLSPYLFCAWMDKPCCMMATLSSLSLQEEGYSNDSIYLHMYLDDGLPRLVGTKTKSLPFAVQRAKKLQRLSIFQSRDLSTHMKYQLGKVYIDSIEDYI